MDFDASTLDPGARGERGHPLKCSDVFGPAIRVAAVINGVYTDPDIACAAYLGECECKGEEYCVTRRNVRNWDAWRACAIFKFSVLWHVDLGRKRRPAEASQVDGQHSMLDRAERPRDMPRGGKFDCMSLSILKTERDARKALFARDCRGYGAVHSAREQHNGNAIAISSRIATKG